MPRGCILRRRRRATRRSCIGTASALARDASSATHVGFVVCRYEDDAIVGVFNIGEIVRGLFKSAYLGYYAHWRRTRGRLHGRGLELVLRVAFRRLKLHRVEANVQPSNTRSLALVRRARFRSARDIRGVM